MDFIGQLLEPKSVAIVGASDDPRRMNGAAVYNLLRSGYSGEIFPVNPRREEVLGLKCWPSVSALPKVPDTVIVITPADNVAGVMREVVSLGISTATVVGSGFGEGAGGPAGRARERELKEVISGARIRVLGPNTVGVVNVSGGYFPRAAHNSIDPDLMISGGIALVAQSGAIGNTIFNRAQAAGVGVHSLVGTGDQIDLSVWDLVDALLGMDDVRSVGVVVESLGDIRQVAEVSRRAYELSKPVVVLPLGTTSAGASVAMSHTGALATNGAITEAVLRDAGFLVAEGFDEVWGICHALEGMDLTNPETGGLGLFCLSGGEAAFCTDRLSNARITLKPPPERFVRWVEENMRFAAPANPFDATGELMAHPELLVPLLDNFIDGSDYSHVLIASPVFREGIAERQYPILVDAARKYPGRVTISAWSAGDLTKKGMSILRESTGAVFEGSEAALGAMIPALSYRERRKGTPPLAATLGEEYWSAARAPLPSVKSMTYSKARQLLLDAGLAFEEGRVVNTVEAAISAAADMGYPVVLKADVDSSTHKAELGLVETGIDNAASLSRAMSSMRLGSDADSFVVERMAGGGVDVLLGATRDASAGLVLTIGAGGGLVEFVNDVALGVGRFDADRARALLALTAVGRFLARRHPEGLGALAALAATFTAWFEGTPDYTTAEVNPLRLVEASHGGWRALDARIA
jgi:acetate---CoA ligase (ADP-forming)